MITNKSPNYGDEMHCILNVTRATLQVPSCSGLVFLLENITHFGMEDLFA